MSAIHTDAEWREWDRLEQRIRRATSEMEDTLTTALYGQDGNNRALQLRESITGERRTVLGLSAFLSAQEPK